MSESLVTVDVGGQSYPYKTEPRCHVCTDHNRLKMETTLAQGRSYERIVELFADSDAVTPRSLQGHVENGHMPVRAAAVQAVAQARSAEITEALKPVIQESAVELAFAHTVLDRVRARVQAAEVESTVRDGMAAAKLIADSEKAAADDVDELAFMAYKVEISRSSRESSPKSSSRSFSTVATRATGSERPFAGGEPPRAPRRARVALHAACPSSNRHLLSQPGPLSDDAAEPGDGLMV